MSMIEVSISSLTVTGSMGFSAIGNFLSFHKNSNGHGYLIFSKNVNDVDAYSITAISNYSYNKSKFTNANCVMSVSETLYDFGEYQYGHLLCWRNSSKSV